MSPRPLTPLNDALAHLLSAAPPPGPSVRVSLGEALGRITVSDQHAILDVPPADNSAMDGYAVRHNDAGRLLSVGLRLAAGDQALAMSSDSVARIFTGAEMPGGADAVVMQEDVELVAERVRLPSGIVRGQHVRPRGQDCREGDLLLPAGRRLQAQDLGLLASQGFDRVDVRARLRVALLSTGSELREPGGVELPRGAIYNSNRPMLAALLQGLGMDVLDLGIVRDDPLATRSALLRAAEEADVIITSGGVSVGEADHVRDVVRELGDLALWKIAIKPGKPFAHGRVGTTPFLGLPGNPSSAFVTFVILARPFLLSMQGRRDIQPFASVALADFNLDQPGTRTEYLRVDVRLEQGEQRARAHPNQSSGMLSSLSGSNALAVIPAGTTLLRGDRVEILPLAMLTA